VFKKKTEGETPALFTFESYLIGILRSLDLGVFAVLSATSEGSRWSRWLSPEVSHEQNSPHNHNSHNRNINVREKGQVGDTEDAVGDTQSKYHLNIVLCAGLAVTNSPEWQYAGCCQGGNGG